MAPLVAHFDTFPLARINQAVIDQAARALYPLAAASTFNRQVYTPISAVLKHASTRGLCELGQIERPTQPKGRIRWLSVRPLAS